ncbi:MAG: Hypothetical protein BHV28_16190 [Candidatus Tokpelaia hoelldobleri]|uniref:Translocation and assembly module TamB C-terminal domain-containing protein n=1 Tax=Candidatus Tokpelaia hoelldobleri TaxID=1902579 RepID=A0A1U9JWP1_9HYPH|nr:MAG: Hypothetical protein BHV28_16190 [Candidatus Tokpelaia hoelldoblerii]
MMKKTVLRIFFLSVAALALAVAVLLLYPYGPRQEDGSAGKSLALAMLEKSLSSPGRRVSISNIDSLWSSHGVIRSVTVADGQGVFASVKNITFDWSRLSILRGRVAFEKLEAERIDIFRKPVAPQTAAPVPVKTEKTGRNLLALPSLPVDVLVDKISARQIVLGESLLGNRAAFGLDGDLHWTGKVFDMKFDLPRLDGAGGAIAIAAQKPSRLDGLAFSMQVDDPASGLRLQGSGKATADGFPRQMVFDLSLQDRAGRRALVPFTNGDITLEKAAFHLAYGENGQEVWNGTAMVNGLASPAVGWKNAAFTFGGPAQQLDDPEKRHVGMKLDGAVEGLRTSSVRGGAVQDKITFHANADWRAGAPLTIQNADIKGAGLALSLSGTAEGGAFSNKGAMQADLRLRGKIVDMAVFEPRVKGALGFEGTARGKDGQVAFDLRGRIADAIWNGRPMKNTTVTLAGTLDNRAAFANALDATLKGEGQFDNRPLVLEADVVKNGRQIAADKFSVKIGEAVISGHGKRRRDGALEGTAQFDVPDLSLPAALLFQNGKGSARGTVSLAGDKRVQNGDVKADMKGIEIAGIRVGTLDARALMQDIFGVPRVDGTIHVEDISVRGVRIRSATLQSRMQGKSSHFTAAALMEDDMSVAASGTLVAENSAVSIQATGWQLLLDKLEARKAATVVTLKRPTKITLTDKGAIGVQDLALVAGQGSFILNGTIADRIRLDLDARQMPLAVVNMVRPDLAVDGVLTAKVNISGSRSSPVVDADIDGRGVTAALLRGFGLQPLDVRVQAKTSGEVLTLDARAFGGGLDAAARGTVSFKTRKMALDVNLQETPLNFLNSLVKDQDLSGVVTGTAQISGTLDNPSATFKVSGRQLSARALTESGIQPLTLQTAGSFAGNTVQVENFDVSSASGIGLKASGRLPLKGNGIDLKIDGGAPLGFANRFLAGRGAQLSGVAQVNVRVSGSLAAPKLQGAFLVDDGRFVDPQTNARFNNLIVRGRLEGDRVVLEKASARSASGGSVSVSGSVSTDVGQGLPADLTITLNHTAYNDGEMVSATANGAMTITGALLHEPLIKGKVQVEKAEITIPDNFGGAALIDVRHKHTPRPVAITLRRAGLDGAKSSKAAAEARDGGPKLDLLLSASRVFIRGRGLDAEIGGKVRLAGYLSNVHPVGRFELVRGRFELLTKRLDFESGQVMLTGNMNPELHFVARVEGDDVTVTVTVNGTPDDLDIALTSQPALPQDEILSRLVFNRSVSELSPFQIAQLGLAAAQLAGVGGNTSLLGNLRGATGLDDLDVTNDGMGNTSVKAGRYIRDNIYLGVEAGSDGTTGGTLNLDINKNLKAKGAVGSDAKSGVGVFYEKDY